MTKKRIKTWVAKRGYAETTSPEYNAVSGLPISNLSLGKDFNQITWIIKDQPLYVHKPMSKIAYFLGKLKKLFGA